MLLAACRLSCKAAQSSLADLSLTLYHLQLFAIVKQMGLHTHPGVPLATRNCQASVASACALRQVVARQPDCQIASSGHALMARHASGCCQTMWGCLDCLKLLR